LGPAFFGPGNDFLGLNRQGLVPDAVVSVLSKVFQFDVFSDVLNGKFRL
jgi:hypothetical protein